MYQSKKNILGISHFLLDCPITKSLLSNVDTLPFPYLWLKEKMKSEYANIILGLKIWRKCWESLLCFFLRNDIIIILESTYGVYGTKFLKIIVKLGNYVINSMEPNSMESTYAPTNLTNITYWGENHNIWAITIEAAFS